MANLVQHKYLIKLSNSKLAQTKNASLKIEITKGYLKYMIYSLSNITEALAIVLLLSICILTIIACKQDHIKEKEEKNFLFKGQSIKHAIASSIGSVFSATYFVGAIVIYGTMFKLWMIVLVLISTALTCGFMLFFQRVYVNEFGNRASARNDTNILFEFLNRRLALKEFRAVTFVYFIVYFGLLIEELAIARLTLHTIFGAQPVLVAALLSAMCIVMYAYVYTGGFRAVLTSDYVQLIILVGFLIVMVYTALSKTTERTDWTAVEMGGFDFWLCLIFGSLFLFSWFVCSIEFYSRLNLANARKNNPIQNRKVIIILSMVGIFIVLSIGGYFGAKMSSMIPTVSSPTTYAHDIVDLFLNSPSKIIAALFLAGLFCMIFTTVDTILIALLQNSWYSFFPKFDRKNMLFFLLLAALLSTQMDLDSVSAVGIHIASWMLVLVAPIAKAVFNVKSIKLGSIYILLPIPLSSIAFLFIYSEIKLWFAKHIYIPIISISAILFSFLIGQVFYRLLEKNWRTK